MSLNTPDPPIEPTELTVGKRVRNLIVVLVAIALSVALFLGLRTQTGAVTLATLSDRSTPLEVALSNSKPTLMEFYADWCTVCQKMVPDIAQLEQEYAGKVNFVMLNVDNSKWLPEILKYRVDGIPHFVYLGKQGEAIAQAIGEQPRSIMASNLEALLNDAPLPYTSASGQVSKYEANVTPSSETDDPRLHSSQVVK
ncbi:thioredoxin family protein [Chroococcidiopsis thermalis]|jgi:thiol-disulfide isomerase/thioredoxin|uniref:Thioredoxin domain-containing protein n=1 Tax=Chroococcidiopsis thermalis (strain PCC 7203) TaxID=251229 RepID=K9U344_CHRTP|nr:thioredoxin family protein [Chroococcidiopsis thermalis]AFY89512.1 Thioredoxin domain-containing protein [Chroococcidiopsis thermalis PCC 7203]